LAYRRKADYADLPVSGRGLTVATPKKGGVKFLSGFSEVFVRVVCS